MERISSIIICLVAFVHLHSQNFSGIVRDEDGQAIFAATVYPISDLSKGVNTNIDGAFSLALPGENDTIVVSFIGYNSVRLPVITNDQGLVEIILVKDINLLDEITIAVKNPISQIFAVSKIEKLDIYFNPFAQGDALKSITALPYSTTTDESANPSLRGSSAERSSVIFNGVPIYNPVRNTQLNGVGNFSLFNTEMVDAQYVYASNPPLTYGNTTAGLIDIQSRKDLDYNETQVSATMAGAGLLTSQSINDRSFIQAYSNYQNSSIFTQVNQQSTEMLNSFGSLDFGLNYRTEINDFWSFNLFGYYIDESYDVNINQYTYEGEGLSASNRFYSVLNLKNEYKQGVFSLDLGIDRSSSDFSFGNLASDSRQGQNYFSGDYKYVTKKQWTFQAGLDFDYQEVNTMGRQPLYFFALFPDKPSTLDTIDQENELREAYFYTSKTISEKWKINGGLRSNLDHLSRQISISYTPNDKHQLLFSTGHYNSFTRPVFQQLQYNLLKSDQVNFDYTYAAKDLRLQAAAYLKRETGERTLDFIFPVSETVTKGLELFVSYDVNDFINLSLSNTYIDQTQEIYETKYSGPFDLNYFAKGAVIINYPSWPTFTLSYMDRPGGRFSEIDGGQFHEETQLYQPNFRSEIYSGEFGTYRRLDLGLSHFISLRSQSFVLFANISNVLNSRNQQDEIYSNDYSRLDFSLYQQRIFFAGIVWSIRN